MVEGLAWAAAPRALRRITERLQRMDDTSLRIAGLAAAGLGVLAVWLVRG
ncbi:MAG: DUF2065 domain-containing protein [Geminicoccaceae bacterium]|nr:DUF2065 domain-containing protein [Geminicoccaceae bacterium]